MNLVKETLAARTSVRSIARRTHGQNHGLVTRDSGNAVRQVWAIVRFDEGWPASPGRSKSRRRANTNPLDRSMTMGSNVSFSYDERGVLPFDGLVREDHVPDAD